MRMIIIVCTGWKRNYFIIFLSNVVWCRGLDVPELCWVAEPEPGSGRQLDPGPGAQDCQPGRLQLHQVPFAHAHQRPFSQLLVAQFFSFVHAHSIWIWFFLYIFFGGLECVGQSFAYVAHFVFLRDVWIRTRSAAGASRCATNLANSLPWILILR